MPNIDTPSSPVPPVPLAPPSFRARPRPLGHSPLNPHIAERGPHPINVTRRTIPSSPYGSPSTRRGSFPLTPARNSPRSPLYYLDSSPSSTMTFGSSLASTPFPATPQSPHENVHMLSSTVNSSLDTVTPHLGKTRTKSMPSPLTIRDSSLDHDDRSLSFSADGRPAWIKRRPDLHEIPPSPPIVEANYLLEHDPTPNPAADHSIASPFVNRQSTEPITSDPHSKRLNARRPSGLARELARLHVDDQ